MNINFVEMISFILLLILAGIIKASEIAISSVGENKIEEMKSNGNKKVTFFERIKKEPDSFFGSLQFLYWMTILFSALMGQAIFGSFETLTLGRGNFVMFIAVLLIVTSVILIFCLLLPTAIGFKYSNPIAIYLVKILFSVSILVKYPVKLLTLISNIFLKPFNEETSFTHSRPSEDEILDFISDGVKSGVINETEQEIIENILEFNDLKANEVMIPRTDMVAVDITEANQILVKQIIKSGHSLLPAFEESPDNIVGIIHSKDMMKLFAEGKPVDVKGLLRPAHFIPETKPISQVLKEMQQIGERMTIVTDEYGGTEGIITIEDILEEIIGEIKDKTKTDVNKLSRFADGTLCVLGSMFIDEFNEAVSVDLPESEEYNTVAGFIAEKTGRILNPGESFKYEGINFELIKKIRQKMVQFKVSLKNIKSEIS